MSIHPRLHLSNPLLRPARPLLTLAVLGMILFYTVALVTWVPNHGFVYQWQNEGGLRVVRTLPDHVASAHLQTDDQIVAIDGTPVLRSPWRWLFAPGQAQHTYTIRRGEHTFQIILPTGPYPPYEIRWREHPPLLYRTAPLLDR
jgi:hypothetical protein